MYIQKSQGSITTHGVQFAASKRLRALRNSIICFAVLKTVMRAGLCTARIVVLKSTIRCAIPHIEGEDSIMLLDA